MQYEASRAIFISGKILQNIFVAADKWINSFKLIRRIVVISMQFWQTEFTITTVRYVIRNYKLVHHVLSLNIALYSIR